MLGKDGRIYDRSFDSDDIEYSLALEGVDLDDLEDMSEEERNEVLEDAGLDSDDFDF